MTSSPVKVDVKAYGVAPDGKTLVFVCTCPTFSVIHAEDADGEEPRLYLLATPKEDAR